MPFLEELIASGSRAMLLLLQVLFLWGEGETDDRRKCEFFIQIIKLENSPNFVDIVNFLIQIDLSAVDQLQT